MKNLQHAGIGKRFVVYILFTLLLFSVSSTIIADAAMNLPGVENCERCVLLTDLSQHRIIMVNLNKHAIVWEWKPSQSNIAPADSKWFINYSDVKPVYENKYLLISSSAGGVALIRIADKKAVFYSYAGGNTHSIELLPDGNIVSASSTGNYLMLFHVDTLYYPKVYTEKIYLPAAHNVVWDKKRKLLWAAATNKLYSFTYNFNCSKPKLIPADSTNLPDTGAHDLFPVYDKDSLYLTTSNGVYEINPDSKKIVAVGGPLVQNIKSISSGPDGFPTLIMKPKIKWWSDEVLNLQGDTIFQLEGLETYKARWFLPNEFSYNNETIKVCTNGMAIHKR